MNALFRPPCIRKRYEVIRSIIKKEPFSILLNLASTLCAQYQVCCRACAVNSPPSCAVQEGGGGGRCSGFKGLDGWVLYDDP